MNDTSFENAEKMRDMIRSKSPIERLKMGCMMHDVSRRLVFRAIHEDEPNISEVALRQKLFLRFYGSDVTAKQREDIMQHFANLPNLKKPHKKASFESILAAEALVQNQTYDTFGRWFVKFCQGIDVLLQLCYHECVLPEDILSDEYKFIIYVFDAYYQISLSFRSCSVLMEKGLYHDSLICCRSMLENLVKYKYLLDHKEHIMVYELDGKDKLGNKVTIKRVWEYVAGRNSQKVAYTILSKVAHKNFGSSLPRLNAADKSAPGFSLVPLFNRELAGVVINHLLYLLYGYINLAEKVFPYRQPLNQASFYDNYKDIKIFLEDQLQKKKIEFPQSSKWCAVMEKIVR